MGGLGDWILLSPAGLAAGLAALVIPLVIHLISRSRGRRVFIGSTRLIRAARRKRVHELRMSQWLLFITRALMLLVAALILGRLAAPGLETLEGDVAYVTPGWLSATTSEQRGELRRDFESFHVLTPGFPSAADFQPPSAGGEYDLWPLLAERLSLVSHEGTVHVFSSGTLGEFGELAPSLPNQVNWHSAEVTGPVDVKLPLRVAVIRSQAAIELQRSVELALQVIRRHRLPDLQWAWYDHDESVSSFDHDVVIQAALGPATLEPDAQPGQRWIDLSQDEWKGSWTGAGFPQLLLEAMLDRDDLERIWFSTPIPATGLPHTTVDSDRAMQLPRKPAQSWLAIVLILLWGIERWLSERRTNAPV